MGSRTHLGAPIEVKFRTAERTHVSVTRAKFHVNRCNESPLRGKNADFRPLSKFNTGAAGNICKGKGAYT